jgi:hypothetical protein
MAGGPELLIILFLVFGGFWLWALIDLLKSEFENSSNKIIWLLVIILLPIIGSLLYLFVGKGQKTNT